MSEQLIESGLWENCTIRLFERTEGGRKANLFRLYSGEAVERLWSKGAALSRPMNVSTRMGRSA